MTITIEISHVQEVEQLLQMLKSLDIEQVNITETLQKPQPVITKGDKKVDPRGLFGIWKDNPRTLEHLRAAAWKRNWHS